MRARERSTCRSTSSAESPSAMRSSWKDQALFPLQTGQNGQAPGLAVVCRWRPQASFQHALDHVRRNRAAVKAAYRAPGAQKFMGLDRGNGQGQGSGSKGR